MTTTSDNETTAVQNVLREIGTRCPFGPAFFAGQLRGLVRERCPTPDEELPSVQIHLRDGEQLDLCHVIGFAPLWLALAVWETGAPVMRTELVPYESIERVTIAAVGVGSTSIGFEQAHAPTTFSSHLMTPEQALRAAGAGSEAS